MNQPLSPQKTAEIIFEVLPYIKQFRKKIIVIKFGGHAMIDEKLKSQFTADLVLLQMVGFKLVVVHGGGPQIGESLKNANLVFEFIDGLRKTSSEVMKVVEKVLMQINSQLVKLTQTHSDEYSVIGLNGSESKIFKCIQKNKDLGFVGEVVSVNPSPILNALNQDQIPIICPVGFDELNQSYNINADVAASNLAISLGAEKLIFLTDTTGVLDENSQLIGSLNSQKTKELIKKTVIKGGMIPKVNCGLDALKNGVKRVHIIDGRVSHTLLIELLTNKGIGTVIDE